MKLSRTVSYAIGAVLQLGRSAPHNALSSVRLAADGGMPERFLLQILRQLVVHGVLRSQRGVFGGYVLARRLGDISLLDIIEAIEGPIVAVLPATPTLPAECLVSLRLALGDVATEKRNALRRISLGEIVRHQPIEAFPQVGSDPVPLAMRCSTTFPMGPNRTSN